MAAQDNDNKILIEKAIEGLAFADGLAWSHDGYMVVADSVKKTVSRMEAGSPLRPIRENDGGVSGIAYDVQGRLFMCESTARRVTRLDRKGNLDVIAETFEGKKLNAPNDITVRRDGQIYFTDPAFGTAQDHRDLDFFGIYHVTPKGEMEAIARWKTRPNGVALSADGKTLYVTDSDRHTVAAFDLDPKSGAASNQREIIKGIEGVPGGIRTDVNGRLYVAALGVGIWTAAGKPERMLLDGERMTNCAWGDGDFSTLYVTSRKAVFRARVGVKGALQY